ncbi:hypothetical protein JHK85_001548 [Glycine max]|nr:hypothetical protein JHK85_001548 [Glycine max]
MDKVSDWHSFQIGGNWEEIFGPVLLMEVLFICLILSILMEAILGVNNARLTLFHSTCALKVYVNDIE